MTHAPTTLGDAAVGVLNAASPDDKGALGRAAVAAWRAHPIHGQAQADGKAGIFAEFRLRVAEVVREITLDESGVREARELK